MHLTIQTKMSESLYNPKLLLDMMEGNHQEVKDLAEMLFDLGPKMLQEINNNINKTEWKKAGDIAHKLKSSLRLWQMNELIDLALFIEINGRNKTKLDEISSTFTLLESGFTNAMTEMKKEYS